MEDLDYLALKIKARFFWFSLFAGFAGWWGVSHKPDPNFHASGKGALYEILPRPLQITLGVAIIVLGLFGLWMSIKGIVLGYFYRLTHDGIEFFGLRHNWHLPWEQIVQIDEALDGKKLKFIPHEDFLLSKNARVGRYDFDLEMIKFPTIDIISYARRQNPEIKITRDGKEYTTSLT